MAGFAILRAVSHSYLETEVVYHAIAITSLSDGQPVICFLLKCTPGGNFRSFSLWEMNLNQRDMNNPHHYRQPLSTSRIFCPKTKLCVLHGIWLSCEENSFELLD